MYFKNKTSESCLFPHNFYCPENVSLSDQSLSPLAQFDGNDTLPITPQQTFTYQPLPEQRPSVSTRNVNHTLDRNKQIKKLKKDADFIVEVSRM